MTNGRGQEHGHGNHPEENNPDAGFERQDLGSGSVYGFFIAIIVGAFLIAVVIRGTLYVAQRYANEHGETVRNALLRPKGQVEVLPEDVTQFPQPRLETNERTEIRDFRLKEEQELHSYAWTDQPAGTMRIPIERAMELIAQRGLPTTPSSGPAPPSIVNMVKAAAAAADHSGMTQPTAPTPASLAKSGQQAKGKQ